MLLESSKRNLFLQKIKTISSLDEYEKIELEILGRNGLINELAKKISASKVIAQKKIYGQELNSLKAEFTLLLNKVKTNLLTKKEDQIDITLPGNKINLGERHPMTKAIEEIINIFKKIGFYQVSYPEIEYEFFAFDSLNMPKDHPARDEFESFSVDGASSSEYGKMVLSPHTSSGQVREMWRREGKPIRMINISRCFRRNFDVTHTPMFHQFEGLCVDKGINIKHLKAAISHFVKEYFGYDTRIRLRPHHFQFTEPSFEVDITCSLCKGTGLIESEKCRVCKSGWLELGGCGVVHPNVLLAGKINPDIYSGWAFGFGVERVYMIKHKLNDLRKLYTNDINLYQKNL